MSGKLAVPAGPPVAWRDMTVRRIRSVVLDAIQSEDPVRAKDAHAGLVAVQEVFRKRGESLLYGNQVARERLKLERWLGEWVGRNVVKGSHARRLPPWMTRSFASRCRALARIPEDKFEAVIAAHLESDEITAAAVLRWAGDGNRRRRGVAADFRGTGVVAGDLAARFPNARHALKSIPAEARMLYAVFERIPSDG
jgi:hypothetical protein